MRRLLDILAAVIVAALYAGLGILAAHVAAGGSVLPW
jgi:hypothetical protein